MTRISSCAPRGSRVLSSYWSTWLTREKVDGVAKWKLLPRLCALVISVPLLPWLALTLTPQRYPPCPWATPPLLIFPLDSETLRDGAMLYFPLHAHHLLQHSVHPWTTELKSSKCESCLKRRNFLEPLKGEGVKGWLKGRILANGKEIKRG